MPRCWWMETEKNKWNYVSNEVGSVNSVNNYPLIRKYQNCSETALKLLWNCFEIEGIEIWKYQNCSETALKSKESKFRNRRNRNSEIEGIEIWKSKESKFGNTKTALKLLWNSKTGMKFNQTRRKCRNGIRNDQSWER